MQPLADRLAEYVRACFTGLWIQSHEHEDALQDVTRLCVTEGWRLAVWDLEHGMRVPGHPACGDDLGAADPLAAVRSLTGLAEPDSTSLLVLVNYHRFLQSAEIVQAVAHQIVAGKQQRTFIVVLSPVVQIPVELERLFTVIVHDLPDREQLEAIAHGIATKDDERPCDDDRIRVLDAASGLTRYEAENAFSLSLVRHGQILPDAIWELKTQTLRKSGLLTLHRGGERFDHLGGLEALKSFCMRALRRRHDADAVCRARGVMLLSPPGCGKSQFCKALGNETGRPTLTLDVGTLMGSLVGQTEERTRQALRIADAMAPCVLMIDEIEKALGGVMSSGSGDSGVSARLFGCLLTWLNDRTSDVFVVATCNDISRLPPEFARAERFDGVFFLDLPSPAQREAIWHIYIEAFGLDKGQPRLQPGTDDNWTGAEIRACCRLASLLDQPLVDAAQNVVPVAITASESVERLRQWANGRCLCADQPGIYHRGSTGGRRTRRRVQSHPSNN